MQFEPVDNFSIHLGQLEPQNDTLKSIFIKARKFVCTDLDTFLIYITHFLISNQISIFTTTSWNKSTVDDTVFRKIELFWAWHFFTFQLKKFNENNAAGAGARAQQQAVERVMANVQWRKQNEEDVENWLRDYFKVKKISV